MLLTRRTFLRTALFTGIIATTLGLASAPFAGGGIALRVDIPRPDDDPRLQDVAFIARTCGCMGVNATITVTAEGLVEGKRISKVLTPINVTPPDKSPNLPVLGFRREWPAEGQWIISIVADSQPYPSQEIKNGKPTGKRTEYRAQESVIIPILPDGSPEMSSTPGAKYERHLKVVQTNKNNHAKTISGLLTPNSKRVAGVVKR